MTYRLPPRILVLALTLISAANAEIAVDPLVIARRCCSHQAAACCAKTIENRLPLNCSLPLEELVSTSNCIQMATYGRKSVQYVRIEDVECCQDATPQPKPVHIALKMRYLPNRGKPHLDRTAS
ncbi:hypothetical protein GCK32_016705 [Trichostrongylus colubriformis]|uniref:Uncharacterized protein n=1 Tax=Trichostrongylus colubriformis TaxID=6319 RepID=A0AAN8ERA7_TRICO